MARALITRLNGFTGQYLAPELRAAGYRRLLECPAAMGETFNVCSGRAHTLQEVLYMVRANPAFVRANKVKRLLGNRNRLLATVGEVPDIGLQDTLRWMLEDAS